MPIFSRRVLQRLLNENRIFLQERQVKELVNRLNSLDKSIATEWEVVLINALSKLGNVFHEKDFNGKTPDLYFECEEMPSFVADIKTISDDFYENNNSLKYFRERFYNFLSKKKVSSRGIRLDITGDFIGEYGEQQVKLKLPHKKDRDINTFIQSKFSGFINSIKNYPHDSLSLQIEEDGVSIRVSYNPEDQFSGGGYPSYTLPYSLKENPIYRQLTKKAEKLRKSNYSGILGIFLCDGGCDSLNNNIYNPSGYGQENIIEEFFRNNTSISFIFVFTPEEERGADGITRKYIKSNFYRNRNARYPVKDAFSNYLQCIGDFIPSPESMPVNAIYQLKSKKAEGLSNYGGYEMSGDEIKISSRMLVELLAGDLDYKKFDEDYKAFRSDRQNPVSDFFRHQLRDGKMIEEISVEKCADEDDDWIRFKFGNKDAAISEFQ
jgi:hypothetical protein